MVHILNDMIGACYQLNFLVKGENKGRTRYITKQAAGKMYQTHGSSWPKCAHAEENVAGVEMTLSHVGWTQTNCSLCQMLRHMCISQSYVVHIIQCSLGLKFLKRHHVQQLGEATCHAFMMP